MSPAKILIGFIAVSSISLTSCKSANTQKQAKSKPQALQPDSISVSNDGTINWLTPVNLDPYSFLEIMKRKSAIDDKFGIITMTDDFPENWVKRETIDSLIKLVGSTEKCNCFKNPLSSYIPNDSANVGGYVIAFIKSYREKSKLSFGLYACPKTNNQDARELIDWWANRVKH